MNTAQGLRSGQFGAAVRRWDVATGAVRWRFT